MIKVPTRKVWLRGEKVLSESKMENTYIACVGLHYTVYVSREIIIEKRVIIK